ncbi:MAG: hypothetical protein M1823_001395 [Watsoniomyces obsoletus]|nr:MAG: hypothetical protein M1823_001395 [Watsoniomyces obsoletus]
MTSEARASASPPPEAAPAAKGDTKDQAEVDTKTGHEVKNDAGEVTAVDEIQENVDDSGHDSKDDEATTTPAAGKKSGSAKKAGNTPNGSSARSKKGKRKSSIGIPEHRSRKLTKKKAATQTHIDAKPGDQFLGRLKGYPMWPVVVADEDMLPDALRNNRGVATKRPDGTYREDYADGGKEVHKRVFPVMFLETNEFAWMPNTDLIDSDFTDMPKKVRPDLEAAYKIAAEHHPLDWFKKLLKDHLEGLQAEEHVIESSDEKKKGKGKRKSKAAEPEEDVDLDEADVDAMDVDEDDDDEEDEEIEEEKPKSKKRKKVIDSDDEDEKPAKTPKRKASTKTTTPKLKLTNPKTPNGTGKSATKSGGKSTAKSTGKSTGKSTTGKSASKSSAAKTPKTPKSAKSKGGKKSAAKVVESEEEEEEEHDEEGDDEEMADAPEKGEETAATMAEQHERRQKELLFLRHKLQRGLLMRDVPPPDEEMQDLSDFILKLESYTDLESSIILKTKINKVLKGIIKLTSIPKDEEFKFRERCKVLLQKWNLILAADPETPVAGKEDKESAGVNGVDNAEKPDDDQAKKSAEEKSDDAGKKDTVDQEANEDETADKKEEIEAAADKDEAADDTTKGESTVEAVEEKTVVVETTTETVEAAS